MAGREAMTTVIQKNEFATDEELVQDHSKTNVLLKYGNRSKEWVSRLPVHLDDISYAEARRIINELDTRPHKPPVRIIIEIRRYCKGTVLIVYSSSNDVTLASTHKLGLVESFRRLNSTTSAAASVFGIVLSVLFVNPVGIAANAAGLSNSMYDLLSNSPTVRRYFQNLRNRYRPARLQN